MDRVNGSHGFRQKGNRYFWKIGTMTMSILNQGFRSKADCEEWIESKREKYGLDWRAGFLVKFKAFDTPWLLVSRNGSEVKVS